MTRNTGKSTFTIGEKTLPDPPVKPDRHGRSKPDGFGRRIKTYVRRTSLEFWIWELLSLLVSLTCVGAIIILLAHFDDKPLPNWSYGLTLNGIISILSGIAKSSPFGLRGL
jgi:hypothetical protein